MNIRALRAFRAVVSEGSVIAAARAINLSQPAVSRLLGLLERELGLTLFLRQKRRLILTDEGRAFEREAGRILANLDEIPRIAAEIRASGVRRLRIVTMPRLALSLVCPAVARFARAHPEVRVSVDLRTRRDLELWIGGKEYDLGFGGVPVSRREVRGLPLVSVRSEVLLPAGHPLAARAEIAPEDMAGERVIAQFPGLLQRRQMDEVFGTRDVAVNYDILTSSSQISCQLVACGAGITVLDRLSAANFAAGVVFRPLVPERWQSFGAILPRGAEPDPAVASLIESLRAEATARRIPGLVEPVDS